MEKVVIGAFVALLILVFAVSCSGDGSEYYHVPQVSVDVDSGKKNYKPSAPKPRTWGGTTRKR